MIQATPQMRVLVAVEPTDFRRGIDGLARQLPSKSSCTWRRKSKIAVGPTPSSYFVSMIGSQRSIDDRCCGARLGGRCRSTASRSTAVSGRSCGSPAKRSAASNAAR